MCSRRPAIQGCDLYIEHISEIDALLASLALSMSRCFVDFIVNIVFIIAFSISLVNEAI